MNFVNIKGEKISAVISTFGAELFSLKNFGGLEYLWREGIFFPDLRVCTDFRI